MHVENEKQRKRNAHDINEKAGHCVRNVDLINDDVDDVVDRPEQKGQRK